MFEESPHFKMINQLIDQNQEDKSTQGILIMKKKTLSNQRHYQLEKKKQRNTRQFNKRMTRRNQSMSNNRRTFTVDELRIDDLDSDPDQEGQEVDLNSIYSSNNEKCFEEVKENTGVQGEDLDVLSISEEECQPNSER